MELYKNSNNKLEAFNLCINIYHGNIKILDGIPLKTIMSNFIKLSITFYIREDVFAHFIQGLIDDLSKKNKKTK